MYYKLTFGQHILVCAVIIFLIYEMHYQSLISF